MTHGNEIKNKKILKTAIIMVIITLAAKALGMLRDILLASGYGTTAEAIAYDTASKLPILIFDFVIGGVITASFIPVFNEILVKTGKKAALDFANKYFNAILLVMLLITLVGEIFSEVFVSFLAPEIAEATSKLAANLTRIMFPMVIFTGLAFCLVGLLQSFGSFLLPSVISLVSNLVMVLYFVLLDSKFGVYGLAVAMLVGWGLQFLILVPSASKTGYSYKPTLSFVSPELKRSLFMALPILISSWSQPMCNLINTRFASGIAGGSAITAIGYANRLYLIIVGVFSFVATNLIFPQLSKAQATGEKDEGRRLTNSSVRLLLMIILPITIGLVLLAEPIVSIIYERGEFGAADVKMTATALRFFALGMPFYAVNEVYTKKFFAGQKTVPPMITSLISILFNLLLVSILSGRFGIAGIAISSAFAVLLNVILNHFLHRFYGESFFEAADIFDLIKLVVSSIAMGGAVYGVYTVLPFERNLSALIAIPVGVVVYFILCLALREELTISFLRNFRRK